MKFIETKLDSLIKEALKLKPHERSNIQKMSLLRNVTDGAILEAIELGNQARGRMFVEAITKLREEVEGKEIS